MAAPATRLDTRRPTPPPAAALGESLHATLARQYPGLVAVMARRLGDRQLALDLLQDAVVTTLGKLAAGTELAPDVVAGYVFRTALNHLRNHRRHERVAGGDAELLDTLADDAYSPLDDSQRDANRQLVRRALADLGCARDREVLVRFYLDDQDKDEVCRALGLTGAQFNQVIFRARERMRRGLERRGLGWADLGLAVLAVGLWTWGAS